MNSSVREDVAEFFDRFQSAGDAGESVEAGELFHPTLLTLDPASAGVVTREQVLAGLPRRRQFFDGIGISGMSLQSLAESPIDDHHTLVRASWHLDRTAASAIPEGTVFLSTFLLRKVDGDWQIVVYLNHQDLRSLASA